jgi:hypothetical protein
MNDKSDPYATPVSKPPLEISGVDDSGGLAILAPWQFPPFQPMNTTINPITTPREKGTNHSTLEWSIPEVDSAVSRFRQVIHVDAIGE